MRRDWRKDTAVRWTFYALLIWFAAGCSTTFSVSSKEISCTWHASYEVGAGRAKESDKERLYNECLRRD